MSRMNPDQPAQSHGDPTATGTGATGLSAVPRWLQGAGCGLLAAASAWLAADGHLAGSAVAALACALVGGASPWPARAARGGPATSERAGGAALMAREIVPVWRRHLSASREEADRGVNALLQHFSSLSDGLNGAISAAEGNRDAHVTAGAADDLVERHPEILQSLTEPLERLRTERRAMLEMLREVETGHQSLQRVAAELSRHARHVGLVAMNAAIEANRAGQAKGGFGAVAEEVREMALTAQKSGHELDELVGATTERLVRLRRDTELAEASDEALEIETRVRARALVDLLVGHLGTALEQSRQLRETSRQLRESLDGVFVGFQFQDRLNQMLGSLHDDLDRFEQWLREPAASATAQDAAQWLRQLESTYTMQEQHAFHHGTGQIRKAAAVEFF